MIAVYYVSCNREFSLPPTRPDDINGPDKNLDWKNRSNIVEIGRNFKEGFRGFLIFRIMLYIYSNECTFFARNFFKYIYIYSGKFDETFHEYILTTNLDRGISRTDDDGTLP